jgi:hypothetical protein
MFQTVVNIPFVVMQMFQRHLANNKGSKMSSKLTKNMIPTMFSNQNTPLLNKFENLILAFLSGIKLTGMRINARRLKGGA